MAKHEWGPRYKYHKDKDELAYMVGFNDGLLRAQELLNKQSKQKSKKPKKWKY